MLFPQTRTCTTLYYKIVRMLREKSLLSKSLHETVFGRLMRSIPSQSRSTLCAEAVPILFHSIPAMRPTCFGLADTLTLSCCDVQYFWFRTNFLMSPAQASLCQNMVTTLLNDRTLRIQEPAADTLSGLLKGLSESACQELRDDFIDQLDRLVPKTTKKGKKSGRLRH